MTGAIFDEADLSGALMANAMFNGYTAPAKKAAVGQGAQLGRAVAKAVGKGLWAELEGGDSEDQDAVEEEEDEDEGGDAGDADSLLNADALAHALDQVGESAGLWHCQRVDHIPRKSLTAGTQKSVYHHTDPGRSWRRPLPG